jgi:Holliday junction resolvase RusA-like endonuclease
MTIRLTAAQAARLTKRQGVKLTKLRPTAATWDATVSPGRIWISIPELPPTLNEWSRQHWSVRSSEVARLSSDLTMLRLKYKIPITARPRVQVVYYFSMKRRRDPDGYTPKFLLDGLRYAGIISDDNADVLQLPQPEFRIDHEKPRTEIYITEWREKQ